MPQGEAPRMVWNADSGQGRVLPDEEGRPPGKGTTAHRLAVVPCIGCFIAAAYLDYITLSVIVEISDFYP